MSAVLSPSLSPKKLHVLKAGGHSEGKDVAVAPSLRSGDFYVDAGLELTPHHTYGALEQEGVVVNFYSNRFLKRVGAVQSKESFTREAFFVGVDKVAYAGPRNRAIIKALPDGEETVFRVKHIKYGNHNAMWEVLSGHLYALTGMKAPDSRLFIEKAPAVEAASSDGAPATAEVLVASPKITGYYDLGDFLVNEAARHFIAPENHGEWARLKDEIEAINKRTAEHPLGANDKMQRLRLMEKIYVMLPDYFHREIEKSFIASKFIFNWDFANFDLNNIGISFTLGRNFEVTGFKSVFVDFGNSGAIGFGGKYKELSLQRANTEAKPFVDAAHEYDPELKFSAKEMRIILGGMSISCVDAVSGKDLSEEKLRELFLETAAADSRTLYQYISFFATNPDSPLDETQKASLRFKLAHHISPLEAKMETAPTTGLLTVADLPRNLPFAFLLRGPLSRKVAACSDAAVKTYRDSEIEMAYRLALITDEAIEAVVKRWYLSDEFPAIFPIPEGVDPESYTTEKVVEIFKKRRDALVSMVPYEVVCQWKCDHKMEADVAESEVELAKVKAVTHPNPEFNSLPYAPPESLVRSASWTIECELENKLSELREKVGCENLGMQKAELESYLAERDCSDLVRQAILSQIHNLESQINHKLIAGVLEFIEGRLAQWQRSFYPPLDPSCNFFDLHRYRDLYRVQHPVDSHEVRSICSSEENMERNRQIHAENTFVLEKFMESLRDVREVAPSPTVEYVAAGSSAAFSSRPRSKSL